MCFVGEEEEEVNFREKERKKRDFLLLSSGILLKNVRFRSWRSPRPCRHKFPSPSCARSGASARSRGVARSTTGRRRRRSWTASWDDRCTTTGSGRRGSTARVREKMHFDLSPAKVCCILINTDCWECATRASSAISCASYAYEYMNKWTYVLPV